MLRFPRSRITCLFCHHFAIHFEKLSERDLTSATKASKMTYHYNWFAMISSETNRLLPDGRALILGEAATPQATSSLIVTLFIAALLPPVYFSIGATNLSFSRVFLLLVIVPLLVRLLSGQAGRLMATDCLMMLYCGWIAITYTYHYGTGRIALSGITIVEQMSGYLVGRVLIRNVTDYTIFIRAFFIALLVLFPFALFELFTGRNLWAALFDPVFSVHQKPRSAYGRMGLERVMSGFEHPILFGLFCSLGVVNFFYIYQPRLGKAVAMMLLSAGMTFMSLSSAPLMAVASQALLITWDKATRGRWVLLAVLVVLAYVMVDALSNRTPVTILISTLTFNPNTAWTRVAIWDYGSAAVLANPIMGIGLEDWPRAEWVTRSVDNFWLLIGMRHGLPAIMLLLGALAFHLAAIVRVNNLSPTLKRYRTGYVLALLCIYFTLCTVHIWGGMSSFVFFYIGAGVWFVGAAGKGSEAGVGVANSNMGAAHPSRSNTAANGKTGLVSSRQNRSGSLPPSRFPIAHRRSKAEHES